MRQSIRHVISGLWDIDEDNGGDPEEDPMERTGQTLRSAIKYLEEHIKLRAELERLRAERRWIPVEERLPDVGVRVLVLHSTWQSIQEIIWPDKWTGIYDITHWMPLPPPPLPGKEVQG